MNFLELDEVAKDIFLQVYITLELPHHEILTHGIDVLNGEKNFASWFFNKHKGLNGLSPFQCFFKNHKAVETKIDQIEYMVYI